MIFLLICKGRYSAVDAIMQEMNLSLAQISVPSSAAMHLGAEVLIHKISERWSGRALMRAIAQPCCKLCS